MFFKKKEAPSTTTKLGGPGFFLTWISALLLLSLLIRIIPSFFEADWSRLKLFLLLTFLGAFIAQNFIRNHLSVLFHEVKHAFVSSLVGNQSKGMKIGKQDGHFEYAYTKENAGHNAFITLAPYWLPLFTFPSLIFSGLLESKYPNLLPSLLGFSYGADLLLGLRDAHPNQTDLLRIRGGLIFSYIFVLTMNLNTFLINLCIANYGVINLFNLIKEHLSELI